MKSFNIPIPTLRRLPIYYQHLLLAEQQEKTFISSFDLGNATGSASEQVRKDLSFIAGQGKTHVGYDVKKLIVIIESYLGLMNNKDAVIVGAGNLGHALALYPGFAQYGLKILALFDIDSKKFGEKVGNLEILPLSELAAFIKNQGLLIGILTTPPVAAPQVTEIMVASGIKAIWNFSTALLTVPEEVLVRNVDLSLELAVISHFINSLSISKNN